MKQIKKVLACILAMAIVVSMAACAQPAEAPAVEAETPEAATEEAAPADAKVMKIAHNQPETHPVHQGLLAFKEEVEKNTNGAIVVDIYPSGQLADDLAGIDQAKLGSIQAVLPTAAISTYLGTGTAFGSIEELPFLFADYDAARAAWDGKLGELSAKFTEDQGLITLAFFENGFRNMTNNVHPITTPADLKGLKFRVATSEIRTKTFETLGSAPITIAFTELYTALQQGTVDGQENPLAIINTSKFYEVQKYLSITHHIYNTAQLAVNADFFNGLTAEQQEILKAAAKTGSQKCRELNDELETSTLDLLKENKMEINDADIAAFKEAVQPVWQWYQDTYGEEATALIEAAQNPAA